MTVTFTISGEPTNPGGAGAEPDPAFFRDSIRDSAFLYDVMDGDQTDVEITVHGVDVADVSLGADRPHHRVGSLHQFPTGPTSRTEVPFRDVLDTVDHDRIPGKVRQPGRGGAFVPQRLSGCRTCAAFHLTSDGVN